MYFHNATPIAAIPIADPPCPPPFWLQISKRRFRRVRVANSSSEISSIRLDWLLIVDMTGRKFWIIEWRRKIDKAQSTLENRRAFLKLDTASKPVEPIFRKRKLPLSPLEPFKGRVSCGLLDWGENQWASASIWGRFYNYGHPLYCSSCTYYE